MEEEAVGMEEEAVGMEEEEEEEEEEVAERGGRGGRRSGGERGGGGCPAGWLHIHQHERDGIHHGAAHRQGTQRHLSARAHAREQLRAEGSLRLCRDLTRKTAQREHLLRQPNLRAPPAAARASPA